MVKLNGFPGGTLVKKNLPANAGGVRNAGSIPGSERSPGVGSADPLQYAWLGNSMNSGAGQAPVQGLQNVGHGSTHVHARSLSWWTGSRLLPGKKGQTILPQPGQHLKPLPLTKLNHTVNSRTWHCLGNWAARAWWVYTLLSSSFATYSRPKLQGWHSIKFCWLKEKKKT